MPNRRRKAPRSRNEVTRSFQAVFATGKKFLSEGVFSFGSFSLDKTNAKHWLTPNLDLAKQIFDFMNTSKTILKNE